MKTLLILRHAKSSWDDPSQKDYDRPLNARGLKTAPLMGQLAADKKLIPQIILTSPAQRAVQTTELFTKATKIKIQTIDSFYPGNSSEHIKVLSLQDNNIDTIMIVGHNPGLELLLQHLTNKPEPLPTCSLAVVHLPVKHWQDLIAQPTGKLVAVFRPKEIFKELHE